MKHGKVERRRARRACGTRTTRRSGTKSERDRPRSRQKIHEYLYRKETAR